MSTCRAAVPHAGRCDRREAVRPRGKGRTSPARLGATRPGHLASWPYLDKEEEAKQQKPEGEAEGAAEGEAEGAAEGEAEEGQKVVRTSSKLHYTLQLIHEAKERQEQVLVVCPTASPDGLLARLRREFKACRLNIACLTGGTQEQEGKLRAWRRGAYDGLLITPHCHGVDFDVATHIIFLTPLMAEAQAVQMIARIVRQGNVNVARGTPVKVHLLCAEQTEESSRDQRAAESREERAAESREQQRAESREQQSAESSEAHLACSRALCR